MSINASSKATIALSLAMVLSSCGVSPPKNSRISQLTNKNFVCQNPGKLRTDSVTGRMPGGMIHGWSGAEMDIAMSHFSSIPDNYENFLAGLYKSQDFEGIYPAPLETGSGGSVMGVTSIVTFSDGKVFPQWIQITNAVPNGLQFALQHEVGHAVENFIRISAKGVKFGFDSKKEDMFQEGSNNSQIRDYARSNSGEYFAEAFANFYCSPESHELIRQELPLTFEFLTNVLDAPIWSTDTPKDPVGPKTGIFVALEEMTNGQSGAVVTISAESALNNPKICRGTEAECAQSAAEVTAMIPGDKIGNRYIYKSSSPVKINGGTTLTVLGSDSNSVATPLISVNVIAK